MKEIPTARGGNQTWATGSQDKHSTMSLYEPASSARSLSVKFVCRSSDPGLIITLGVKIFLPCDIWWPVYRSISIWSMHLRPPTFGANVIKRHSHKAKIYQPPEAGIEPGSLDFKVKKKAKIRNRYNQAPHPTQGKWQNTIKHHIQESHEVGPFPAFPAYYHRATMNRHENMTKTKQNNKNDPQKNGQSE